MVVAFSSNKLGARILATKIHLSQQYRVRLILILRLVLDLPTLIAFREGAILTVYLLKYQFGMPSCGSEVWDAGCPRLPRLIQMDIPQVMFVAFED